MSNNIPNYKEYIIFIYDKSVYTSIHDFLLKQYYPYLNSKGITVDYSNYVKYVNDFLNNIYDFYIDNKNIFDEKIYNNKNYNFDGMLINNLDFDKELTIYEYLILLKKMLKLYKKSFDIDYSKTCPKYVEYNDDDKYKEKILPKSTSNLDEIFFQINNIYCRFVKDINTNKIKPLFIGSYSNDNVYLNRMYIYNICSSVGEINEKNREIHKNIYYGKSSHEFKEKWEKFKKYNNSIIMKKMLKLFSDIETNCDIFALFVVTTNPSFEKAFLLYYSIGFKPMLNIFETKNENYLERMSEMCLNYNQNSPQYKKCIENQNRNMLMVATRSFINTDFINYNIVNTQLSEIVQRMNLNQNYYSDVEKFYSLTLAFSYKCSCIFDNYFNINEKICKENLDLLWDYFHINSNINQKLINPLNGNTYWSVVNSYVDIVNNPNFSNNTIRTSVLSNPHIFAFISSIGNKFIDIDKDEIYGVYVCKSKILFHIHENISGNFSNSVKFLTEKGYSNDSFDLIRNNVDVDSYLNSYINVNGKNMKRIEYFSNEINIDKKYIDDNKIEYIFIPSISKFSSDNNFTSFKQDVHVHAFSHLYDVENQTLYYYETQHIYDRMGYMLTQTALGCTKTVKRILEHLNFPVKNDVDDFLSKPDNITDLSKYYVPNNKLIYNKIQNGYADDKDGTLCVILSYLSLFGLRWTFSYNQEVKDFYLKFFIWFLYFNSMFIRQKRNLLNIQDSLQSNLHIVFPLFYSKIYDFIKKMNDVKRSYNLITSEDINCETKLKKNKEILVKNLEEINNSVQSQIILSSENGIISAFKRQFSNEKILNV
jgi:hypothetical protein